MTQDLPGGETAALDDVAKDWRERFRRALGDSKDLYIELLVLLPAPMIVDSWSGAKTLIERLKADGVTDIEAHIAVSHDLACELWMGIEHIAANPAMLRINRMPHANR